MIHAAVTSAESGLAKEAEAHDVKPARQRFLGPAHARVGVVALILAAAGLSYVRARGSSNAPSGVIQVSGRIEGDTVIIASKQPGRISALKVREGDQVVVGQVLAELDAAAVSARYAQALAAREVAAARAEAARARLSVVRGEVPLQLRRALANVQASQAASTQAEAALAQAQREQKRVQSLFDVAALEKAALEKADLGLVAAEQQTKSARAAEQQAQAAVQDARLGPERVRALQAEIQALEAAERQAAASATEAQSALTDLTIRSPVAGTVTARLVSSGEVANAGAPLLEVVDLDNVYLRVFVPEPDVGKIRIGLPARIYTDAFPDRPLDAQLSYIASRAEFTPKDAQTRDERVKLVFATKLSVRDNSRHLLTPGLTADAIIRWQDGAPWVTPR